VTRATEVSGSKCGRQSLERPGATSSPHELADHGRPAGVEKETRMKLSARGTSMAGLLMSDYWPQDGRR